MWLLIDGKLCIKNCPLKSFKAKLEIQKNSNNSISVKIYVTFDWFRNGKFCIGKNERFQHATPANYIKFWYDRKRNV
jgi:hypothetical protein